MQQRMQHRGAALRRCARRFDPVLLVCERVGRQGQPAWRTGAVQPLPVQGIPVAVQFPEGGQRLAITRSLTEPISRLLDQRLCVRLQCRLRSEITRYLASIEARKSLLARHGRQQHQRLFAIGDHRCTAMVEVLPVMQQRVTERRQCPRVPTLALVL